MIHVTKPVKCPACGYLMCNFSYDKNTEKLIFSCENQKHSLALTEDEYSKLVRTGKMERHK